MLHCTPLHPPHPRHPKHTLKRVPLRRERRRAGRHTKTHRPAASRRNLIRDTARLADGAVGIGSATEGTIEANSTRIAAAVAEARVRAGVWHLAIAVALRRAAAGAGLVGAWVVAYGAAGACGCWS